VNEIKADHSKRKITWQLHMHTKLKMPQTIRLQTIGNSTTPQASMARITNVSVCLSYVSNIPDFPHSIELILGILDI